MKKACFIEIGSHLNYISCKIIIRLNRILLAQVPNLVIKVVWLIFINVRKPIYCVIYSQITLVDAFNAFLCIRINTFADHKILFVFGK